MSSMQQNCIVNYHDGLILLYILKTTLPLVDKHDKSCKIEEFVPVY